jgi:hypothetical protein
VAQGPRNLSRRVFGAPWFHPRPDALLKVGDKAVCDAGINVLAVKSAFAVLVSRGHLVFLLGNGLQDTHATLPFCENGGSKRKGGGIREGDHPGLHKPGEKSLLSQKQPGAERLGKPGPNPCARERRRP